MNKLTEKEFQDRLYAVARARKIFIGSGLTKNIGDAFALYQGILAGQERPLTIRTDQGEALYRSSFGKYERPGCPLCGTGKIKFRLAPEGPEGYKTELLCENPQCDGFWYSTSNLPMWVEMFKEGKAGQIDPSLIIPGSKKTDRKIKTRSVSIDIPCPRCGEAQLYELEKCCGAPEGLIECGVCDFQELPSIFKRS